MIREILPEIEYGCHLEDDEKQLERLRITFLIVGPNGLRWRVVSRLDNRAYAAWRLARYYGGTENTWPSLALKKIRKEPREVRKFIHDLAKQFAMMFFGNISRGAVWDMDGDAILSSF